MPTLAAVKRRHLSCLSAFAAIRLAHPSLELRTAATLASKLAGKTATAGRPKAQSLRPLSKDCMVTETELPGSVEDAHPGR